jgi:hypothetical protein
MGSLIEIISRQCPYIAPFRHMRPMLAQHMVRVVGVFALADGNEPRHLGGYVQPANARKQR